MMGTLVSARNWSFGTPHSRDLFKRIKKFYWNSWGPTNFIKSSVFFRIRKRDWAGNSFALQSFWMLGHMDSLNSVVVKKFYLSMTSRILGNTVTESWITFVIWSKRSGITFFKRAFLSNFSSMRVMPCRNCTLFWWSLLSRISRYFTVFRSGSWNHVWFTISFSYPLSYGL